MNLIFSEFNDQSTNYIIDWFLYFNKGFYRDNGLVKDSTLLDLKNNVYSININNESVKIANVKHIDSIWYRRPYEGLDPILMKDIWSEKNKIPKDLFHNNLKYHNLRFKEIFHESINNSCSKVIGAYDKNTLNKSVVLLEAQSVGLKIPKTIITNSSEDLEKFLFENNGKIITKPLYEVIAFADQESSNVSLTCLISSLDEIPVNFGPTLFQEFVDKIYEIRSFYFDGEVYSMAIFSQKNKKTKVDFRNYDNEKMNRMIPYKLSADIEKKIIKLMKKLKLNFGSVDLIKSKGGDYFFLEINPIGQFDFVSKYCNYNLEYKIAKHICGIENKDL